MLSAEPAKTAGGSLQVESTGAAAGFERTAGNRPDTLQHVVGERNEQADSVSLTAVEDWVLAAQPERNAMKTGVRGSQRWTVPRYFSYAGPKRRRNAGSS